jgi:hypothetical protein
MKYEQKLTMGARSITLSDCELELLLRALRLSINPKLSELCCASELGNHNSPTSIQQFTYFLTCKGCNSDALQKYWFLHRNFQNGWDGIP